MPSRRDFFRAAVALPASWTTFTNALRAAGSDESYWQMVQRQFPLDDDLIYLNAANVCPASRPVMDRHLAFLHDFHANRSFQDSREIHHDAGIAAGQGGAHAAGGARRGGRHP